jgi:hypothetical protein
MNKYIHCRLYESHLEIFLCRRSIGQNVKHGANKVA